MHHATSPQSDPPDPPDPLLEPRLRRPGRAAKPAALRLGLAALALAAVAPLLGAAAHAQEGAAPAKPTGLSAEVSHDSVTLTWDDPQDDSISGYVILRRNRDTDAQGQFSELVADTGSAATSYTDESVAAETPYTYRIKAINAHGSSWRSRWLHIDTPAAPVPDKPTGLAAAASHDSVTLTWDDPNDDSITGYVILRRNRDTDAQGQFSKLVADTGSAATTYTDDSVAAETPYTYRIKAINAHGSSWRSRWLHIDTPAAPEPEPEPESAQGQSTPGAGPRANVSEGGTDLPAGATTTGMVAVDGPVARGAIAAPVLGRGNFYTFDKDWFQVTLQAGRTYRIDLAPVIHVRDDGTYAVPLLPEIVALYAEDSDYLHHTSDRESSGPGYAARVDFTPRASSAYYISAAGLGFTAGEYELRVSDITQ